MLADLQTSPIIVCIRCGKISKSFDTFTKLHKQYYPQKHGPNYTKENHKFFVVIRQKIHFLVTVKIIGMTHLKVMMENGQLHK